MNYNVTHEGQKFVSIVFYVLRDVKADGELFIYYGETYAEERKNAGYTQPSNFKLEIGEPILQDPQSVLTTIPSNCFADADS